MKLQGGTENFAAEDDEKAVEDEEIKADLVFFLHTFGSARAVREKLEIQRHRIAGLQRTLRWLEDRQRGEEDNDESSDVGYLHTQSASTLAAPDDSILTVSQRGSPPELMEESPGRELERLQAGCRFPDGTNTAPVIELNNTYDEARMCKVYGCDQRAVACLPLLAVRDIVAGVLVNWASKPRDVESKGATTFKWNMAIVKTIKWKTNAKSVNADASKTNYRRFHVDLPSLTTGVRS
ncbi:hypothetical protein PI125_g6214 [Phytophthora idaei]|nr:hypothetical protein PI125_g6214 [Phytophthora idaei]KAG3168731.1 hypothetical protein PI126_g3196 [Phytophthora idaei]